MFILQTNPTPMMFEPITLALIPLVERTNSLKNNFYKERRMSYLNSALTHMSITFENKKS